LREGERERERESQHACCERCKGSKCSLWWRLFSCLPCSCSLSGSGELLLVQSKDDIERPPLEIRATVVLNAVRWTTKRKSFACSQPAFSEMCPRRFSACAYTLFLLFEPGLTPSVSPVSPPSETGRWVGWVPSPTRRSSARCLQAIVRCRWPRSGSCFA